MQSKCTYLPYISTGYFSAIISDYINEKDVLKPFYDFSPTLKGVKEAVAARKQFKTNRQLLVNVLQEQYKDLQLSDRQQQYINQLSSEETFTVCTAHQPNIFTGYLYFIYKIIHTIKLAETLSAQISDCNFVPVYYMGSEDADLEELGHIYLKGKKYEWKTTQQGAVGRMKVDKALVQLVTEISGQLLVHPHGKEIVDLVRRCYKEGNTIQQATFELVNNLFAGYGLLVLLPDNRLVKKEFAPIIQKELLKQFSHKAVAETVAIFPSKYKLQTAGREMNLFYLTDDGRERIEKVKDEWQVVNSQKKFAEDAILKELETYPERFSPNVILRPLLQEMILPNIAFIGGGSEIAYWLELKKVFDTAAVPFPVLMLRNSFLVMDEMSNELANKLGLTVYDIFKPAQEIMNEMVKKQSIRQLTLENEMASLNQLYTQIASIAGGINGSLSTHTAALQKKALDKIVTLEKKMMKAERKKFEAQQRQLNKLKEQLFPGNNLQERVENFMPLYAQYGKEFIQTVYHHSPALEHKFTVLSL